MIQRILLVEDDGDLCRPLARAFEEEGFEVCTTGNGVDAVTVLESFSADVVISDIVMPKMDGFRLTTHLRADPHWQNLPILLLSSALVEEEDRRRGLDAGANFVLQKIDPSAPSLARRLLGLLAYFETQRRYTDRRRFHRDLEDQSPESLKRIARELLDLKDWHESVLVQVGTGLILVDAEERIFLVNPEAERCLGLTSQRLTGRNLANLHQSRSYTQVRHLFGQFASGAVQHPVTLMVPYVDKLIQVSLAPLRNRDGVFLGVIVGLQDHSLLMQMEPVRLEFSYDLSRQIGAISRTFSDGLNFLAESSGIRHRAANTSVFSALREQLAHLQAVGKNLESISQFPRDGVHLFREPVSITTAVGAVVESLENLAARRNLTIRESVAGARYPLSTDSLRVRQVLYALAQYCLYQAKPLTEVVVKVEETVDLVRVGITFSPEDPITENTDPFAPMAHLPPIGVLPRQNLPLLRVLVCLLGGDVYMTSEEGGQAEITVLFPQNQRDSGGGSPTRRNFIPRPASTLRQAPILVLTGPKGLEGFGLAPLFEEAGIDAVPIKSLGEITQTMELHPAAGKVLCNLFAEDADPLGFLRQFAPSLWGRSRMLLLTAVFRQADGCLCQGIDGFLPSPLSIPELVAACEKALESGKNSKKRRRVIVISGKEETGKNLEVVLDSDQVHVDVYPRLDQWLERPRSWKEAHVLLLDGLAMDAPQVGLLRHFRSSGDEESGGPAVFLLSAYPRQLPGGARIFLPGRFGEKSVEKAEFLKWVQKN